MIDIHLHFDGSLPVATVWEQGKKQNIDLGSNNIAELKEKLSVTDECNSLNEYLEKFELPLKVLQTKDGISECMEALIQDLIEDGFLYAEIRFAPQLHCLNGMSQESVVLAAIDGLNNGCKNQEIKVQLILCCMRGNDNYSANKETIDMTQKYLGKGVCACDLAGAEAIFRTYEFAELFAYARSLEVPFTIHAGEADGAESICKALEFGAKRIGHGVHCIEDNELVSQLIDRKIPLECCPISNIQTKAVLDMKDHPITMLLRKGMKVTINTDNRTVSNTRIVKEVEVIKVATGLTQEEEKILYLNAIDAAFLEDEDKAVLREKLEKKLLFDM